VSLTSHDEGKTNEAQSNRLKDWKTDPHYKADNLESDMKWTDFYRRPTGGRILYLNAFKVFGDHCFEQFDKTSRRQTGLKMIIGLPLLNATQISPHTTFKNQK